MPLFANRGLPLGANKRLYSACVHRALLYGKEIWPFKEEELIRPESNDARMDRWMCSVRPEDRISGE